jgi:hypothetical protein
MKIAAFIIFFSSGIGLGSIILRKIPVLNSLPEFAFQVKEPELISKLRMKIKEVRFFKSFSYEIFLQKILTRIRILSLKTDNKTFSLLQRLREKTQKKKERENDNYWEEIQKATENDKFPQD